MSVSEKISFRPHHFLCTLCFTGKGYSPAFVRNYKNIAKHLTDDRLIEVTQQTDSICAPCPHRRELKYASQAKIATLDNAHNKVLNLPQKLTWGEAKEKIKQNFTLEKFHQTCAPCEWKKFGICEKILTEFLFMQRSRQQC